GSGLASMRYANLVKQSTADELGTLVELSELCGHEIGLAEPFEASCSGNLSTRGIWLLGRTSACKRGSIGRHKLVRACQSRQPDFSFANLPEVGPHIPVAVHVFDHVFQPDAHC